MLIAQFTNVGRDKKCWSVEIEEVSHTVLVRSIKTAGALMSSDIDFYATGEPGEYRIIVGVVRPAGMVTIISAKKEGESEHRAAGELPVL